METTSSFTLEVWSDTSEGDGTSAIYSAYRNSWGLQQSILLSPPGKAFQVAPRVIRAADKDLVVWQAEGMDGSLYGIHGALVSPQGEAGLPFQINHYTELDQREPAVAASATGEALVVWSSYGQDGDRGGIFGRLVKPGNLGEEIEIAEARAGHQQRPQVVADSEGFWVAWETVGDNGMSEVLSVRRLGLDGRPMASEVQLSAETAMQRKILTLDSPTPDSVVVRWWRQDAQGTVLEPLEQVIGEHGPLGPVISASN